MSWQKYDLVFQLLTPLHVGWRKSGNLMQTRGYVPGKNQWAALTARLTREADLGASGEAYKKIGEQVQKYFRFTYLYPATKNGNGYKTHYPWEDDFDYLFLDSYASVALDYASQSAAEGLLHETEFIAPRARDGRPVYLSGQVYVQTDLPTPLDKWQNALNKWQDALDKLQFGGEQGYGWGRVKKIVCKEDVTYDGGAPRIRVENGRITAHLKATENISGVTGPVEPFIGWERNNDKNSAKNWRLSLSTTICYAPGATVTANSNFIIGDYGVWEQVAV